MTTNLKTWALDVAIRAVKTAAQTAVAALAVNASGLLAIDWAAVGSLAALAAITSVLQNLATIDVGSTATVAPPVAVPAVEPVVDPTAAYPSASLDPAAEGIRQAAMADPQPAAPQV